MDLRDLIEGLPPCSYAMQREPWWRCGMPRGHSGDHAAIHVHRFRGE